MKREPDPGTLPEMPPQPISVDVLREKYLKPGEATEQAQRRLVVRRHRGSEPADADLIFDGGMQQTAGQPLAQRTHGDGHLPHEDTGRVGGRPIAGHEPQQAVLVLGDHGGRREVGAHQQVGVGGV